MANLTKVLAGASGVALATDLRSSIEAVRLRVSDNTGTSLNQESKAAGAALIVKSPHETSRLSIHIASRLICQVGLPQVGSPGFGPLLELPRMLGPWHRVVSFPAVAGCTPCSTASGNVSFQPTLPADNRSSVRWLRVFLGLPFRALLGRGAHSSTGAPT